MRDLPQKHRKLKEIVFCYNLMGNLTLFSLFPHTLRQRLILMFPHPLSLTQLRSPANGKPSYVAQNIMRASNLCNGVFKYKFSPNFALIKLRKICAKTSICVWLGTCLRKRPRTPNKEEEEKGGFAEQIAFPQKEQGNWGTPPWTK